MLLAGDIGGTKTRLAFFEHKGPELQCQELKQYDSQAFAHFRDMVRDFLRESSANPEAACFGVPGPVLEGVVQTVNLPWRLSESELESTLKLTRLRLVNDLVATASALPYLKPENLEVIHEGKPGLSKEVAAVLAPGTGLGQAFLHWVSGQAYVVASEGGHADLAPTNELEIQLLSWLLRKFQRVSYERVLSGPGLVNVYNFLKDINYAPESKEVFSRMQCEDPAHVISHFGLQEKDQLCSKALDIFCAILGAQAGNLALTLMATAGVYLGGGIPPKIIPKIKNAGLTAAYLSKGRLSKIVAAIPLYVIKDDRTALLGAAHIADSLLA